MHSSYLLFTRYNEYQYLYRLIDLYVFCLQYVTLRCIIICVRNALNYYICMFRYNYSYLFVNACCTHRSMYILVINVCAAYCMQLTTYNYVYVYLKSPNRWLYTLVWLCGPNIFNVDMRIIINACCFLYVNYAYICTYM